jgi:regulatory protein
MAGTITALKAQKRARGRVDVHLDGEVAFSVALIHALWLKIGQALSDDEIASLRAADTLEQAKQRVVGLLEFRPRSAQEVRQRLKRAGVDEATIDQVIDQLKAAGMLDDAAFAAAWVESRLRANPRGKRMLAWELRQKGADPQAIEASLAGVDDAEAALAAARKRLPRLAALPAPDRRRKLIEYLARNGFAFAIIEDVLGKLDLAADDAVE